MLNAASFLRDRRRSFHVCVRACKPCMMHSNNALQHIVEKEPLTVRKSFLLGIVSGGPLQRQLNSSFSFGLSQLLFPMSLSPKQHASFVQRKRTHGGLHQGIGNARRRHQSQQLSNVNRVFDFFFWFLSLGQVLAFVMVQVLGWFYGVSPTKRQWKGTVWIVS